eukprot:scaffold87241_cov40-Tisochrysis_lutea.AAC.1
MCTGSHARVSCATVGIRRPSPRCSLPSAGTDEPRGAGIPLQATVYGGTHAIGETCEARTAPA